MHMNSIADEVKTTLEEICKRYRELKRGGNVDPYALKQDIGSFIDILKSKYESYSDLREEAEDMLIDVTFMIKEDCCNPLRAKSLE